MPDNVCSFTRSLPQDRVGVPYVHDDCHTLYRPVNQSHGKDLQV